MSDMECASYSVEPVCDEQFSSEDTAVCDTAGSESSDSFDESANEINDCPDNMISDVDFVNHNSWELFELGTQQTNEVAVREVTDVIVPDHDILEEMSISSENRADFAQCSSESEASSDLFSPEHLARIKAVTDTYMACESVEVLKEEKLVPSESDVVFNFDQQVRYNKWLEEIEKEALQAMMLAELSITQYSGYGAFHANPLIPQVIEGLEPKVNGNHLIRNWLSNEKNLFEITFYKPFTFYADVLLSEK